MKHPQHPKGFSLIEVLIVLAFTGVLMVATFPNIIQNTTGQLSLSKTKNMATQLQTALTNYKKEVGPVSGLAQLNAMVKSKMSYTTIKNGTAGDYLCGGQCYKFPDGGLLLPVLVASGVATLVYDPDDAGPVEAVTLSLNVNTGRVTTDGAINGSSEFDPDYTKSWTRF